MDNSMFSSEQFYCSGFDDLFSLANVSSENIEEGDTRIQDPFYGAKEIDLISYDNGFYQTNQWVQDLLFSDYDQQQQQQPPRPILDCVDFDHLRFDIQSPPYQEITQVAEIQQVGSQKEKPYSFSLASLELLKSHRTNGFNQLNNMRILKPSKCASSIKAASQQLSTEEIMRIAGARFIQSSCQTNVVASVFDNHFDPSFSGLSDEDAKKVELAESLLASAERIGNQQFDSASRLLEQCDSPSFRTGNPIQRVVYYFAEALRERIDIETGKKASKGLGKKLSLDIDAAMMSPNRTTLASHKEIPFCQVIQFTGIQIIVDNVADARKVHIVDLALRNGMQWTLLMQALVSRSDCPLELLKITVIGTTSKELIERAGKRLTSFAKSMDVPFSFKMVFVEDLLDLKEVALDCDDEESVAVYSEYLIRSLIPVPDRLDSVMKLIKRVNPCVTVVAEVEANHNSPTFVNRFIEALFFYAAYFDCLEACMEEDEENRMIIESMYFGNGIKNIIATEGDERMIRNVKLDVWRAFFAHYDMVESNLSSSSLLQANLIRKRFAWGTCCTIDKDGKSLILGWKGTPLHSLSAWKFMSDDSEEVDSC